MNGRTAKLLNRQARLTDQKARNLKRQWYRANKVERTHLRNVAKTEIAQIQKENKLLAAAEVAKAKIEE